MTSYKLSKMWSLYPQNYMILVLFNQLESGQTSQIYISVNFEGPKPHFGIPTAINFNY